MLSSVVALTCLYLLQGVDVDFAPLPALTEVHGGSHQQNVCDTITIHIQGVDLTSIVGANLGETRGRWEHLGTVTLPARTAPVPSSPTLSGAACAAKARRSPTIHTL